MTFQLLPAHAPSPGRHVAQRPWRRRSWRRCTALPASRRGARAWSPRPCSRKPKETAATERGKAWRRQRAVSYPPKDGQPAAAATRGALEVAARLRNGAFDRDRGKKHAPNPRDAGPEQPGSKRRRSTSGAANLRPNVRAEAPGADGCLARRADNDHRPGGQGSQPWRVASRARG